MRVFEGEPMAYRAKTAAYYRAEAEELRCIAASIFDEAGRAHVLAMAEDCIQRAAQLEEINHREHCPS